MKTIIKDLRTAAGLTQQQLANRVRVTVRTINSIERGEYNPSLVLAYKIAQVFHTTVEELCCLKENVECEENQDEDHKLENVYPGDFIITACRWYWNIKILYIYRGYAWYSKGGYRHRYLLTCSFLSHGNGPAY